MRVLWVYDALTPQMLALAAEIQRRPDIELEIMTCSPLPAHLADLAAPQVTCRNKVDFSACRTIRKQLKQGNYDLAHAYTSRNLANLLSASVGLRRSPKIVGYRGTITRLSRLDPANWITFWHPRLSSIICVCHATKTALAKSGVRPEKLMPVWEGCAPELLQPQPRTVLTQFGIPQDAFVVGTVANARRVKGLDILMRSAIELAGEIDIYWLVVGAIIDPQVQQLAETPELGGRVKLIGTRHNGGGYSNLFDIYAAPSRKEGLSMGIMEAMAQSSCPVVSDVGGNAELIRHAVDGLVVPSENPRALSGAIRTLYHSQEKRALYASSSNKRVIEQFSVAAWSARLCQAYEQILSPISSSRAA